LVLAKVIIIFKISVKISRGGLSEDVAAYYVKSLVVWVRYTVQSETHSAQWTVHILLTTMDLT